MSHMKRHEVPKNWPIPRKGTAFVVKPLSGKVPVLIVLRNFLKIAQNRKEVKRAIHLKEILVNNKPVVDEKKGLELLDTITIVPAKKSYRLELSGKGKFEINEIKESEANNKIAKIVDKKTIKGKKTQLNLSDGMNFLSEVKCKVNDSVLINFKEKKIEKCLPMNEKAKVIVFAGKHAGKKGTIDKIKEERKMAKLNSDGKEINVLIKQLMVVA